MADKHTTKEYLAKQFKNFKTFIDKIYLPKNNPSVTGNLTLSGNLLDSSGNNKIPSFSNKETLDGFSKSSEGGLLWNNEPIEGGGGGSSEAIDINYNNSTSGLDSDNVQDAIDELDETIDDNKIQYEVEGTKLKIGGGFSGESGNYETLKKSMMMFFDNPTGLETESIIGAGVSGEKKHFIDVSNNGALKYQWNSYGGAYMFLEITAGESEENCNDVLRPNAGGIDNKMFLVSDYNVVCFRFTVTSYNYNITVTKS